MNCRSIVSILVLAAVPALASESHSARGILLRVDRPHREIVVSCEAIPGYMEAMTMPLNVRRPDSLKNLLPGATVSFDIVHQGNREFAEHLQAVQVHNYESEPIEADRLTFLHRTIAPSNVTGIVRIGEPVPDFKLMDQSQRSTRLSEFKGRVVALTFAYSRCPNPNYCFRLSNNLSLVERRFRSSAGRDLILITIVIDPDQDRGKALERYADTWKADPSAWRFLTGSIPDVSAVAERFGMNFWSDEGFLIHTFHTVVIDREGRLAANLEGNAFTAEQLGDLVETVLNRTDAAYGRRAFRSTRAASRN